MGTFGKKGNKKGPGINTASLPDIVFMLLFFFMVSTVMKEVDLRVSVTLPEATELTKLEKKSKVAYIYVGKPTNKDFGTESRLQLNDEVADITEIENWVTLEKNQKGVTMTTSLKIDQSTPMGLVTDIKQALRRASALKISYSAHKLQEK